MEEIMGSKTSWTTILLAASFGAAAHAQTPPGAVQPGQIERQFQAPPKPTVQPDEVQIPQASQKPPANAATIRFFLKDVVLDGVTVYPAEALRVEYADALGKDVSLADIYAIANRLTARYRNDGYILSQVVVPAQSVQESIVRLQAVEGYVGDVNLVGDPAGLRALPRAYADKIKGDRPLTAAALERYLLLMNDLAGTTARATLVPSTTQPGAADLQVQLSHRRFEGEITLDNRGSEALGPWRLTASLDANSLFGRFDRTVVKLATTFSHARAAGWDRRWQGRRLYEYRRCRSGSRRELPGHAGDVVPVRGDQLYASDDPQPQP
jgi:hemolysin activation/secretion protein